MHGGKSLEGPQSPSFKHGRDSKHLPTRILHDYERALNDPNLLELDDDIALLNSLISDQIRSMDKGDLKHIFNKASAALSDMEQARASDPPDAAGFNAALGQLKSLLGRGVRHLAAVDNIVKLENQKLKHVDAERKHRIREGLMYDIRALTVLQYAISDIFVQTMDDLFTDLLGIIDDDEIKSLIQNTFNQARPRLATSLDVLVNTGAADTTAPHIVGN